MCYWCKLGQKDDSANALSVASCEGTINWCMVVREKYRNVIFWCCPAADPARLRQSREVAFGTTETVRIAIERAAGYNAAQFFWALLLLFLFSWTYKLGIKTLSNVHKLLNRYLHLVPDLRRSLYPLELYKYSYCIVYNVALSNV